MTTEGKKPETDWASIEIHYRAGVRPLRSIAEEFGVSHVAITKRAKKEDWSRDLKAKIDAKVQEKVTKAAVTKEVTKEKLVTEKVIVEANATIIASAELVQREDVLAGLGMSRGLLQEIVALSDPRFAELLQGIAEDFDESGPTPSGGWKTDKTNELYRYIISLAGRVKMAKDVAATHGVYIPLQRKVLRMEDEANKGETTVDELLSRVLKSGN